jgi:hypothetical protein
MSTTSDSDEDSDARKDLLARMQQFRAKKNQAATVEPPLVIADEDDVIDNTPLCVQVGWPPDYIEYTGIWEDCRLRGWNVVDLDRRLMQDPLSPESRSGAPTSGLESGEAAGEHDEKGFSAGTGTGDWIPNVQFVPYKRTAWAALMKGQVLANHYYMRSGIVRKAELATTLMRCFRSCHPETYVTELVDSSKREEFAALLESLAQRGGLWLLKAGDSSNATDMHLFDKQKASKMSTLVRETLRSSWLVQSYIERPLLIRGCKFHIRATVLAVGRLKVYLHRHAIALLANRKYRHDFTIRHFIQHKSWPNLCACAG